MKQSELTFVQKHPIILPANQVAVQFFVEREHEVINHEETAYVRSLIQQKYWIIGLRNLLRRIKLNCVLCRNRDIRIFQPQIADLPIEQSLNHIYSFEKTSTDFLGLWKWIYFEGVSSDEYVCSPVYLQAQCDDSRKS